MTAVVFRVDAGVSIGSGHVARCLTLAETLRAHDCSAQFICREHPGHLCDLIESRGFTVHRLPVDVVPPMADDEPERSHWLGASWQKDAQQTLEVIDALQVEPEWLIVDHYAVDGRWERVLRIAVQRVMAIDDLADRSHDCDLLLDQNLDNPRHVRYCALVPPHALKLFGTQYALVRPEFHQLRQQALERRNGEMGRLLIFMGGSDPGNDTAKVLAGFAMEETRRLPVDVVIGTSNPRQAEIRALCTRMPAVELHVQTPHMAQLMLCADVAINGGGSITWERCVLGLPGVVAIQSEDQIAIARAVQCEGAHLVLGRSGDLTSQDYVRGIGMLSREALVRMAERSAALCDGRGAERVATQLINWNH